MPFSTEPSRQPSNVFCFVLFSNSACLLLGHKKAIDFETLASILILSIITYLGIICLFYLLPSLTSCLSVFVVFETESHVAQTGLELIR